MLRDFQKGLISLEELSSQYDGEGIEEYKIMEYA